MEKVILKRPLWDGRVLYPAGLAFLPEGVEPPIDARLENETERERLDRVRAARERAKPAEAEKKAAAAKN